MSDFRKSKKAADSKRKTQGDVSDRSDLDILNEEIEKADLEVDEQIQIIETKTEELNNLEQNLESISEKLGELKGEALQIAYQEINQKMEQKATEIDESRGKLETIKEGMQQKQSEIKEQIGKRDDALTELEETERKCHDVDLSESKDAVNEEKENLEDAQNKVGEILKKIDAAGENMKKVDTTISNAQSKANNIFSKIGDVSKKFAAGVVTFTGIASGLADVNNRVAAPLFPNDSVFSQIQDRSNKAEDYHSLNSNAMDLDASRESEKERRKRESEESSELGNESEKSGKK
jgi:DNA repair exonuclease SbcCD ATPase subunit